jgi:phosphate transport system substrate-binding protein
MRRALALLILVLAAFAFGNCNKKQNEQNGLQGKVSISGAFALYPLVIRWAEEFRKTHPGVKFDIQAGGAGKGITDALTKTVHLGMVSREIMPEEIEKGAFTIAVAKDAVIATISEQNPYLDILYKKGVSRREFRSIWVTGKITNWNSLTGKDDAPIRLYTRSDAAGAPETWAIFLGAKQEDLLGTGVFGDPGLAEAISNEKTALGFNNINYVYSLNTGKPLPGIRPLPIDLNANGRLDENENFYSTLFELNEAIKEGIFPTPPARLLYLVSQGKPHNPAVIAFLEWVLTQGSQYVEESGYVKMPDKLRDSEIIKLKN